MVPRASNRSEYEHLVASAATILSEQKLGLFKLALAINFYNPRLEMFSHLAQNALASVPVRSLIALTL